MNNNILKKGQLKHLFNRFLSSHIFKERRVSFSLIIIVLILLFSGHGFSQEIPFSYFPKPDQSNNIRDYLVTSAKKVTDQFFDGIETLEGWQNVRDQRYREFLEMMSLYNVPMTGERPPLNVKKVGPIQKEGYKIEKIYYESLPDLYVPANLYVPDGITDPVPAILYVCGHVRNQKVYYQGLARKFAQLGFVCLIIETIQWGDVLGEHWGANQRGWFHWYSRGYTPGGVELWNGIRGLDLLSQLPEVDKESVLRAIPKQYIDLARTSLHVAYQHTSHGTQVARGLFGLVDFKDGDDLMFGITNNSQETGKLDFHDYALQSCVAPEIDASDLSRNETAFIQVTRNFLDNPDNSEINVIMWSWCNIVGHKVSQNYLPGMDSLIAEYGKGGVRIGNGKGQRKNPVTFVFMTGHANVGDNVGDGKPGDQAELIIKHCIDNQQFCLDYYSIDTHDMADNYWADAGDDRNSASYGGNYYLDWQNAHELGVDWYENKNPDGEVIFGSHNSQHITANRKAYAMLWILARIAGWSEEI